MSSIIFYAKSKKKRNLTIRTFHMNTFIKFILNASYKRFFLADCIHFGQFCFRGPQNKWPPLGSTRACMGTHMNAAGILSCALLYVTKPGQEENQKQMQAPGLCPITRDMKIINVYFCEIKFLFS